MDALSHIKNSPTVAHAYVIRGKEAETFVQLKAYVQEQAGGAGSPDALCFSYDSFGVDEARQFSSVASLKPLGQRKYIVLRCAAITVEAQNALLKIVEEGAGHSVFFFVVGHGTALLSTLQSRCVVLKQYDEESATGDEGKKFLAMPYGERMAYVEKLSKDGERDLARSLVSGLLAGAANTPVNPRALRDLLEADQFLALSGSSIKSVLGHLALTL